MKQEIKDEIVAQHNAYLKGNGYKRSTYVTPKQLAERLSVSEKTLQRMRNIGEGPPFKIISRRPRYPIKELEAWLAENSIKQTAKN